MSQNTFSKKTTSLHADEGDKRMSFHRNVSESLALEHDTSCFTSTTLSGNCCRFSLRSSTHSTLVSRILQPVYKRRWDWQFVYSSSLYKIISSRPCRPCEKKKRFVVLGPKWWPVNGGKRSLGSTICSRGQGRREAESRCAEVAPWSRPEDTPMGVLIQAALVSRVLPRWPLPARESVELYRILV